MEFKKQNLKFNIIKYACAILLIISILSFFICPINAYAIGEKEFILDGWHLGEKGLNAKTLYKEIKDYTGIDVLNTKSDVVVAIIDSGLDVTNPFFEDGSLWENTDELFGKPNVDDDKNGVVDDINGACFIDNRDLSDFSDCMINNGPVEGKHWHGTHVAGIVHSVAPNVKIMPIRAGNKASTGASFSCTDVMKAILYATDNGADIINMSFGQKNLPHFNNELHRFTFNGQSKYLSMQDCINYASNKGVLVVAAAGNDREKLSFYPAKCDNVLSVMASNENGELWDGSNYGFYDVAAPGVDIISTIGSGVKGSNNQIDKKFTGIDYKNGTSMAAPYVSGVAALIYSVLGDNKLVHNAFELMPYLTSPLMLSKLETFNKLKNENLLLDYVAVSNIFQTLYKESDIDIENGVITKNLSVFDNKTITLEPSRYYNGKLAWYNNGELVSQNGKYVFIPEVDTVIELKVDGILVEKFVIEAKSYDNYLLTIIGGVIGGIVGLSLIVFITVYLIKKKKIAK